MEYKVGDRVLNRGKVSSYKGQSGIVIAINDWITTVEYDNAEYGNGIGEHPNHYNMLKKITHNHLPEDLFIV